MTPLLLSTWSFGKRGNDAAWPALERGGPAIDAVEKVCQIVDADPEVDSVGFGGLPDAAGHVTLDGCIMLSPSRSGSVCAVRRFMHPVSIARRVMEQTRHVMLAGDGADAFADSQGFLPADLLSASASDAYQKWLRDRNSSSIDQSFDKGMAPLRPVDSADGKGRLFFHPAPPGSPGERKWKHHDTIGVLAIDATGRLAGACSTSGTPFKTPGRVGDSPIIGHGLYVDPAAGAATATGTGELIMGVCGSFLAVECLRRGASPMDAAKEVLRRIASGFDIKPEHQVAMIVMRPNGEWAAAALRPGYYTSARTNEKSEVIGPAESVMAS